MDKNMNDSVNTNSTLKSDHKDLKTQNNRSLILNVLTLLLVGYLTRFVVGNEAGKIGGWNNLNKAKTLYFLSGYQDEQNTKLDQLISFYNGTTPTAPTQQEPAAPAQPTQPQEQFPTAKLTPEQVSAMKKGAPVDGDANAQITIIEYTDPECPYCIRHHKDKTIATTMSNFPGKVNHILKVVEGVNHPGTEKKSVAIICAGIIGGDKNYYNMSNKIAEAGVIDAKFSPDKVNDFAKELGLDGTKFASCLNSPEAKDIYVKNRAEAKSVKANGTPGNLIINNLTNETTLVAGAYPADEFKKLITPMIK